MLLLSGCHTADVPESTVPEAGHGEAGTEHVSNEHETNGAHAAGDYATAAAFPSTTPPSGKESVTPSGYWGPRKVNTDPYVHGDSHGDGGHGAPAQHEAGHGEPPASH